MPHMGTITMSLNAAAIPADATAVNVVHIMLSHIVVTAKPSFLAVQVCAVEKYARLAVCTAAAAVRWVPGAYRSIVSPCPWLFIDFEGGRMIREGEERQCENLVH